MKIKCKICGYEFPPTIEKHYVARDCTKTGALANLSKIEEKIYDAFDCPNCGCQVVAQERKRNFIQLYEPVLEEEEEEDGDIE